MRRVEPKHVPGTVMTGVLRSELYPDRIEDISQKFDLPIIADSEMSSYRYGLAIDDDGLYLADLTYPTHQPMRATRRFGGWVTRKNLFGQAIGMKSKFVVDATAGFGEDAILLTRMGFSVLAIERSGPIAALLDDMVQKFHEMAKYPELLEFRYGDSIMELVSLSPVPDAILLDPMYPEGRKRSIRVRRSRSMLRSIVGDDVDMDELLEVALSCQSRVVVKRPHFAPPLRPERLSKKFEGKLVRYDVYFPTGPNESLSEKTTGSDRNFV